MAEDKFEKMFDEIVDLRARALEIMHVDGRDSATMNLNDSQDILTFIRETYITDDTFDNMLSDLEVFIMVNVGEFELTSDIIDAFVRASNYIKESDFEDAENILVLLLAALDVLD